MARNSNIAFCVAACMFGSLAQSQTAQSGNLAATCQNLAEMNQGADPQAMQMISGIWDSTGVQPGTPGIIGDTQIQARSQIDGNGTFRVDQYGCFQPFNIDGTLMAQSCANSFVYGEWTAHFAPDGSIVMVMLSSGSGFNGGALPMSCGVSYLRMQDANTMTDMAGNLLHRSG